MSDPKQPSRPDRPTKRPDTMPAPDPADLGTAYGMEISMDVPAANPDPAQPEADGDSLGWIRRWLDRHAPR